MPKEFNNYYEPFIGGGAVYFNIHLENFIKEINKNLLNKIKRMKKITILP